MRPAHRLLAESDRWKHGDFAALDALWPRKLRGVIVTNQLSTLAAARSAGHPTGIYSVCSAHPLVIEAAMRQAIDDGTPLLIEATSNQVDQFGGYTGMRPADFRRFVLAIAQRVGLAEDRICSVAITSDPILARAPCAGGDAGWPKNCSPAMRPPASFKLHLDASIRVEAIHLCSTIAVVAERAARLCAAAEAKAGGNRPVYVIGTEVPVPGGATEALAHVEVTSPQRHGTRWKCTAAFLAAV